MKILGLGICPPPQASGNPAVTPELLASCLARYSRSNKGIDAILASIDRSDPDRSVDNILKFVDYGHASIAGMTGGIAMVIDGLSMFLAYKIFEIAQLADGQESSTRYITLDSGSLLAADDAGIPPSLAAEWEACLGLAFELYRETYQALDTAAESNPAVVRIPPGADAKLAGRLRKNYALDRSRYLIPFATRTNAAYVMTARAWTETVKQLDSLPLPEAHACAAGLREELAKFVPRLIRHSSPDEASRCQANYASDAAAGHIRRFGVPVMHLGDEVAVNVENGYPRFFPSLQATADGFAGKDGRYSIVGPAVRRVMVRASWNNMAIAELRDLNRHRTGFRLSPLVPVGFYLPPGITHERIDILLTAMRSLVAKLAAHETSSAAYVYGLLLGTQVAFEHSTHLDKFIYEIELRTGLGAHFRYAEHLLAAYRELVKVMPDLEPYIKIGTAEPE
jgi:thymidylate synthase ThyX